MARPTDYNKEMLDKTHEYIKSCVDIELMNENTLTGKLKVKIPTIEGLAVYLDVNKTTIYEWESKNEEFSNVIDKLRSIQGDRLLNNGLAGTYNPTIAKVLLTKHGYREGVDTDITSKGDKIESLDPKHKAVIEEFEKKIKQGL